jgi:hypothetical protein
VPEETADDEGKAFPPALTYINKKVSWLACH